MTRLTEEAPQSTLLGDDGELLLDDPDVNVAVYDAYIADPPAGNLVQRILLHLEKWGCLYLLFIPIIGCSLLLLIGIFLDNPMPSFFVFGAILVLLYVSFRNYRG